MDFKLELKGMDQLARRLEAKIRRLEQTVLRQALVAFAEPIRAEGERLARSQISSKINFVIKTKMRGSSGQVFIGPSVDPFPGAEETTGKTVSQANIAYWFEFGYNILQPPYHSQKGAAVFMHVGARPSLTPAFLARKETALAAMEKVLKDALEQEIAA